jgi:hypothetical protein
MGWKKSAPYGASDLAKIRAGFLHKAERLLHGAQIAKNLEDSDKWYQSKRPDALRWNRFPPLKGGTL